MSEMRVLESTSVGVSDGLTPDTAEGLAELARGGDLVRESYSVDESGRRDEEISLRSYETPEGETRWAVVYDSEGNREVSDSADRATAEGSYEAEVRGLAACAGPDSPWWGHADVVGVDQGHYSVTVEHRTDGEWWEVEEQSAYLGRDLQLSRVLVDRYDLARLDGADGIIANALYAWVQYANETEDEAPAEALRVTVCGTTKDGAFESTSELELSTE
ncbi:hypothetical protein [Streptomyces celluloflavus]|uniref:hypothetical protein n=1 Tax=Streptomyces celluloflavus TaxID=58344 RepID=UPI003685723B